MFLWDWFTGVLKGLGLMNKSGNAFKDNRILMPWPKPLTGIFTFNIKKHNLYCTYKLNTLVPSRCISP